VPSSQPTLKLYRVSIAPIPTQTDHLANRSIKHSSPALFHRELCGVIDSQYSCVVALRTDAKTGTQQQAKEMTRTSKMSTAEALQVLNLSKEQMEPVKITEVNLQAHIWPHRKYDKGSMLAHRLCIEQCILAACSYFCSITCQTSFVLNFCAGLYVNESVCNSLSLKLTERIETYRIYHSLLIGVYRSHHSNIHGTLKRTTLQLEAPFTCNRKCLGLESLCKSC
jgi:hypothetical protein